MAIPSSTASSSSRAEPHVTIAEDAKMKDSAREERRASPSADVEEKHAATSSLHAMDVNLTRPASASTSAVDRVSASYMDVQLDAALSPSPRGSDDDRALGPASAAVAATSARVDRSPAAMPARAGVPSRGKPATSWKLNKFMRANAKWSRLVQAALLKMLLHAIRQGSVEGVRVAIERGVLVHFVDSRQRNLIMFATKCDTDARLAIVVILAHAGCDVNHTDQLGWNCLHYACAAGALDVAKELVNRGARVEYNPYGYGAEEFIIRKVVKAKSLLQHTEQLSHEQKVMACWDYFCRQASKTGYHVECPSHCRLGKPLKVAFRAAHRHSPLDRIRVVDVHSKVPLWQQVSKTVPVPEVDEGSITLDIETMDSPSLYRVYYEKYEPMPTPVPSSVAEEAMSIKDLDSGRARSIGSVNKSVLAELASSRRSAKKPASSSTREVSATRSQQLPRRVSTTGMQRREESEQEQSDDESEDHTDDTITATKREDHPAPHSIAGVYRVMAMSVVSVSTLNKAQPNEYDVVIQCPGRIGLCFNVKVDMTKHMTNFMVRHSSGQAASVNPGDCLVAVGDANIEHAGLRHTLWELNETPRPMVLRFRRGTAKEKKSLFSSLRSITLVRAMISIQV